MLTQHCALMKQMLCSTCGAEDQETRAMVLYTLSMFQ